MTAVQDAPPALKAIGTSVVTGESLFLEAHQLGPGLHASIGGRISAIDRMHDVDGREWRAIDVDAHRPGELVEFAYVAPTPAETEQISTNVAAQNAIDFAGWIDKLIAAGVSTHRIASPDLHGQLMHALRRPVDTVLCNLLDSDARLPLNAVLAADRAHEIAAGIALLAKLSGAGQVQAVIDSTTPAPVIAALQPVLKKFKVRLIRLQNDYPQADPSLLLYELFKRRLRPGRLPTEQGVLMLDAPAARAVGAHFIRGEKMLWQPLAVRDHRTLAAQMLLIPVGTLVKDVLSHLQIDAKHTDLRHGDLLRDLPIAPDEPITDGELTLQISPTGIGANPDPCVRCGWCVDACPTRIHPAGLLEAAQCNEPEMAERFGIEACIECGICSFVCPSQLPLLQSIRLMKSEMRTEALVDEAE